MIQKKSLGQNFLNSNKVVSDIIEASKVSNNDLVIEVGPGEGVLTEALLKVGATVVSIEKDDRLIPLLENKFESEIEKGKFKLIHADILNLGMSRTVLDIRKGYKVVANIPYYITGQILRKFLESEIPPKSMTLMVQKEVAERIVAKPNSRNSTAQSNKVGSKARRGKESLLSLSVKIYGDPVYIKTISRAFFKPQPNVDSAILHIQNIRNPFPKDRPMEKEGFFKLIHAGFAHKRKRLFKNLTLIYSPENVQKAFLDVGVQENIRAEDLSLEEWVKLCDNFKSKK